MFIHQHTLPFHPQCRGRWERDKDYVAGPDQPASARVGGCVWGIPWFRSPPRPLHASLNDWMTASCRAAHHQRDLKLLLFLISQAVPPGFPPSFP